MEMRLLRVLHLVVSVGVVGRELDRWRLVGTRRSRIGVRVPHHLLTAVILGVRRDSVMGWMAGLKYYRNALRLVGALLMLTTTIP
jgi:hypothetical protein